MKKDNEKTGNEIKNVSGCIRQKLSGFDIVSIEYSRKQQIRFRPIVIIYKPVKKWHSTIDCSFSTNLATAYRAEWSTEETLSHARAYHCYYCSSYYIQKARYQKHMEKCSEMYWVVYNFTNQNILSFDNNIGNKGDLPLIAYKEIEITAPAKNFLIPEQNKRFIVSYTLIFAFNPKLNINCVIVQKSFGHFLLKLATVD